jgi:heptosyltransferase-3
LKATTREPRATNADGSLPRRALIIKLRHIGDALLGTAVATALKASAPKCRITYLVTAGTEELVALCPDVDTVLTLRRSARHGGGLGRYLADQASLLSRLRRERFDLTLDLGGGDRAAFLAWVSGAARRVGVLPFYRTRHVRRWAFHQVVTSDVKAHTVQQDLDVLRAAGFAVDSAPVHLRVPEAARQQAAERLRAEGISAGGPLLIVHPTTRWQFKAWPEDRFAECVRRLLAEGIQIALTCGPGGDERDRVHRIVEMVGGPVAHFPGTLSLTELAAVLACAHAFLGVDSAPTHLAAALGVPCVVLFGPTGAYNWGPWVPTPERTPYPATGGTQTAGPHIVVQQAWDCSSCGLAGCLPGKRSECLEALEVNEVVAAVLSRIAQRDRKQCGVSTSFGW